jgi:dTDP-4-dehydro-6-deoxy-alpha-D-glucopyranose 2,3-dehydratase
MTLGTDIGEGVTSTSQFWSWLAERSEANRLAVNRVPFAALPGWSFDDDTWDLRHTSGRFFSITGVEVRTDRQWHPTWSQPIIVQPEIGILGLLVKSIDGVPHFLVQAKHEPGNVNGLQLSPTVQATRSNYLRVHGGSDVRYLEYFTSRAKSRVLVDVLQSEQGSWFLRKRNRNMIVEAVGDVPLHDDFRWLTLHQLHQLLQEPNAVNMDTRTVLSCVDTSADRFRCGLPPSAGRFAAAVAGSIAGDAGSLLTLPEVLSWLTDLRARREHVQRQVPLAATASSGWYRTADAVAHDSGDYFEIIGVDVAATSREVRSWAQPLLAPVGPGLVAFLAREIDGAMHVLVQARSEAGQLCGVELAPTVQCRPHNYPAQQLPPFVEDVLGADPRHVRYDAMQSEEGGRFHEAVNRYMIVEVPEDPPLEVPADYCWLTVRQLLDLMIHGNYLNVEARSLVACIQAIP